MHRAISPGRQLTIERKITDLSKNNQRNKINRSLASAHMHRRKVIEAICTSSVFINSISLWFFGRIILVVDGFYAAIVEPNSN